MDEEALLYEDDYEPEDYDQHNEDDGATTEATPAAGMSCGLCRPGRGGASSGNIRYFIIRSSTLQNIHISVRVGAWATTRQNDDKLDDAFRKAKEVRLIYSVNGSSAFQGYAVMRSPVGKFGRPVIWENGKQFGNPFAVEWRILFDLPHDECGHVRNPFNENRQVFIARDGTELPQEQGDLLVRMMQERAAAAGAKPPRQQLAALESGGRMGHGPALSGPGPRPGMLGGRMGVGPHGPPIGPGMRPLMPGRGMMGMGPPGVMGPMGPGMGPGMVPQPLMEQISTAMTLNNFNPAALTATLQQAGMGMQPGVGPMQQPGMLQAIASAMVTQMAALPPEQQALAMTAITASNPMLAEAIGAVISSGGPAGMGPAGMQAAHRPSPVSMGPAGMTNALGGGGGGMGGMAGAGGMGDGQMVGGMGDGQMVGGMGGGMGMGNQMQASQQHLQQEQAQQQLMNFNRDDYVLEGSDGRLRSGRSRSRSRSPVRMGGGGGGALDFSSMTYEQYLQQYSRVQQEVSRRVGVSNGQQRGRSQERSPRHVREPTPASHGAVGQAVAVSGGGFGGVAGGGSAVGGMAAKAGGQPYTEEEYIRVTQAWYASRGQPPPSESYIRQHYRQMLAQLQQR
ncbi:hypothetical protein GPECTOR_325g42 [Gonium pectorale]|uniref:YTH domain-containing protein n=1 Tax=Gonium pectorale TaxID=33097 RepID=A0A150FWT8_GONPE|nr:hypothetical protein GPECTOR_325g42 [Gonium pectorale]|eukprot:KXZ41675.1 hypothetical protein GPECTOR_325g42 [Gonium pectorale]